jgi:hypothetical protein
MRLAIVCSAHGFGHLGRQLSLSDFWRSQRVDATFFTAVPSETVHSWQPTASVVRWTVDVGLSQPDSLQEDLEKTLILLEERCSDARIDALSKELRAFDRVLVDIAPAGLEAARRADRKALAVGNFDWAWIYRHYPQLHSWAERFSDWQAPHPALSLWPGPGLSGFLEVQEGGLLARRSENPWPGLPGRTVLVCFGGFGLKQIDTLLPVLPGVTWVLAPPMPRLHRPDCIFVDDLAFPALIAGADAVFTKPGYGILGECLRAGTPMVWAPRGAFPEAPSLVEILRSRGDESIEDGISLALQKVWSRPRPAIVDAPESRIGAAILQMLC